MKKAEATVPVMANQRPWNEYVLRGQRKFKTLSFDWKYRGPILLYNSMTVDAAGCNYYGILVEDVKKEQPVKAIVGMATVTDVKPGHYGYNVLLSNPKRFKKPILFAKPAGAVRVFRAPAKLLKRATV